MSCPECDFVVNGYVYQTRSMRKHVVVFLGDDRYGLLGISRHIEGDQVSCPMFQSIETGQWQFTKKELRYLLMNWGAERVKEKLELVTSEADK